MRAPLLAAALLLTAVACQPAGPPGGVDDDTADGEDATQVQDDAVPSDLDALVASSAQTASEWQAGARPVELFFVLADERVAEAQITWMAPAAEQLMVVTTTSEGTSQQRPTLATLQLTPIPGASLDEIPDPPEGSLDVLELARAGAEGAAACGVSQVETVRFATGAPTAWDGTGWVEEPTWRTTVGDDITQVEVDPATGQPRETC